ncbi:unnamed protein product [Adineta steineri]|uniref:Uncharacterized protein n=1 Tax=Adineta steineri TaxID=433720 RepID=A0A813XI04_9BILA|nr:unnamed protein product [Adineta steineri]CAF0870881.1 unnamed protein product [Adineta steineri]
MIKLLSPSFIRRYQILTIFSSLIIALLLICLDASSWRIIETNDKKLLAQFYSPFQYDSSRYSSNTGNKTFKLHVGPLWRCLTTTINGKQIFISQECTINNDSFDYIIISIGIGTFILYTISSICIISGCLKYYIDIIRLCMSFILELATLWLIYGFFHIQKVLGPLYGWASIGFFIGIINVIIICVLEWDDYFRDVYKKNCSSMEIDANQKVTAWISNISPTEIDPS